MYYCIHACVYSVMSRVVVQFSHSRIFYVFRNENFSCISCTKVIRLHLLLASFILVFMVNACYQCEWYDYTIVSKFKIASYLSECELKKDIIKV